MCGIYFYKGTKHSWEMLEPEINLIQYRGPDNTHHENLSETVLFGFHRLAIMGITETGNQPMKHPNNESLTMVCNGEIYNYIILAEKYEFELITGSDCEIILLMFEKFGIEKTINELDGVFMFVIHDDRNGQIFAGRDPVGVRPGFMGKDRDEIMIASEAKSLIKYCNKITPFPPGTWWCSESPNEYNTYFHYNGVKIQEHTEKDISDKIRSLLTNAVKKRLMAEREIGCLLSGGLDSSLILFHMSKYISNINVFATGLDEKNYSELKYVDLISKELSLSVDKTIIDENIFVDEIQNVLRFRGEPNAIPHETAFYLMSQKMKNKIKRFSL